MAAAERLEESAREGGSRMNKLSQLIRERDELHAENANLRRQLEIARKRLRSAALSSAKDEMDAMQRQAQRQSWGDAIRGW